MRSTKSELLDQMIRSEVNRDVDAARINNPIPRELAERGVRLTTGNTGDHALVPQFLVTAGRSCSAVEFQSQLEDPSYEPVDRILIRHGSSLVGHVRLIHRVIEFGQLRVPITEIADLVALPEYATWGLSKILLREAERRIGEDQILVGLARSAEPAVFEDAGWTTRGRFCYSLASPRDVISRLREDQSQRKPRLAFTMNESIPDPLHIRLFRHVEQDALVRLYNARENSCYGRYARDAAYWSWLICRRAFERIYVATRGTGASTLDEISSAIVAYAVMSDERIVELVALENEDEAVRELLQRACYDSIERGFPHIRFDGPPNASLHQLLRSAGGEYRESARDGGQSIRLKLFQPHAFLRQIGPLLVERAREADLEFPVELGLLLSGERYLVTVTRRSANLTPGRLGRSYLEAPADALGAMLWGSISIGKEVERGAIVASTNAAIRTGEVLFPRLPLWYPPLDSLPA